MSMKTLQDLFVHELKDLYSAEKQLTAALPKMAKAASSPELKEAFNDHLEETQFQLERVHGILQELGENPGRKKCTAMEGLIEEGAHIIKEKADPAVKDAALIAAAQRVEHYEISGYGTARAFAQALGHKDAAKILDEILDEESSTNEKLNTLALKKVNPAAVSASTVNA
jgi:ferritin-like metal-binding protein YciE